MLGIACFALLSTLVSGSPTAYNCLPGYYHDDKGCTKCSQCPVGYGLKNPCSKTEDTQCQPCIEGYDYSDTNGFDECILCDTYSNCLPGKPKLIKKCTVSSPPECDGCEDGYYSEVNGCAECSSPCRTDEEEVQKCLTEHDRICKPRGIDTVPIASSSPTTSTSTINSMEVISMSTKRHTVVPKTETERVNTDEVPMAERSSRAQGTRSKYLKIFIPVGVMVIIVVAIILICAYRKMRKARRRKANDQDLLPFLRKGLDRFLRQLSIDDKKMISREISNSRQGYADWRAVLDKLNDPGLLEESRGWNARDEEININKFLAAYGEKEGSTVAGLIQAIRDAGLELSAEKLKKKLGSDGDGSSGNTDQ